MNIKTKNEKRKLNSSQESLHSITVYSFENELIRTEYNESNVTTVIMQMRKNIFQLCEKVDDNFANLHCRHCNLDVFSQKYTILMITTIL
ncbi:hypothetical protein DERF_001523 [Dermatophagoides farinae]|uniref:Uncharacterized protein n=1 Tax=Dermatophagoides farinae TaxID=6954 RepID=A0A922I8S7_DERFA|nr:hypothetical protein DERF_001523 [Dermatophagoides farinae]